MQHANPTVAILFIGILGMWPTAASLLPSAPAFNHLSIEMAYPCRLERSRDSSAIDGLTFL
jgi:hypothetical protein